MYMFSSAYLSQPGANSYSRSIAAEDTVMRRSAGADDAATTGGGETGEGPLLAPYENITPSRTNIPFGNILPF